MSVLALHHVSVVVRDLEVSRRFYQDVLELQPIERPPFSFAGAWFASGELQIHLIQNVDGTFRNSTAIDNHDYHFAFRTDDFEQAVDRLVAKGFREDSDPDDPKRMMVRRDGIAGFPQLYLRDPDLHIIEINGAP